MNRASASGKLLLVAPTRRNPLPGTGLRPRLLAVLCAVALAGGLSACWTGLDLDAAIDGGVADDAADAVASPADAAADDVGLGQDASAPVFEVGEGERAFVPLEDGDPLVLHMGFQGGWHVFPGARAANVDPGGAVLSYALRDLETGEVETFPRQITLADDRVLWTEDGGWERFGDALVIRALDVDVLGRSMGLWASLTDTEGRFFLEDERVVVITLPEED
jgi:hypothetical protein